MDNLGEGYREFSELLIQLFYNFELSQNNLKEYIWRSGIIRSNVIHILKAFFFCGHFITVSGTVVCEYLFHCSISKLSMNNPCIKEISTLY